MTTELDLIKLDRDLAHQASRISELSNKVDRQDAHVDALRLDVRQLIVELRTTTAILQEVSRAMSDGKAAVAKMQAVDEAHQKAIDGIQTKGWAVISGVIGTTIASIYSLLKH